MEKEYIERGALLEELQEEIDFESAMYTEEQNKWLRAGLSIAARDVRNQPTADVVPREEAERWKNAMMGECMLSCCILRDEFMQEAEIAVAKKIFKDIQSCIGYINWDEPGENILSFVVDFKKFNDFKEKYTKEKYMKGGGQE